MKELVFLMPWAPFASDRERMGISALAGRFKVTIADLSPLLAPRHSAGPTAEDTVRIESYALLDEFLREKKDAVFCDYVLGRSPLLPSHARLFRAMARNGTSYFVVFAAELAAMSADAQGLLPKIVSRLRSSDGLLNYAVSLGLKRPIARLRSAGFYARPARIYAVDDGSAAAFAAGCGLGPEVVRPVNSLDYSAFLSARARGLAVSGTGTCVLIDEGLLDSRDFSYVGLKPLSGSDYYPLINAFLEKVRRELGLRPVVAAHPKADARALAAVYPGAEVVQGRTLEAIAGASLVLAHWSTAVNFAVICGKPLLLLKSAEMESKGLSRFVDNMAAALGAKAVLVENCLAGRESFAPASLPRSGYGAYAAKYIRSERAGERETWESVADDLAGFFSAAEQGKVP